jgi:predicted nuclease of restriction endonuclease-like (RecB) superfamily
VEEQGNEVRAEYGTQLLKYLSVQLTRDFGKGFGERELRKIRQFYLMFPIRDTLRPELGWSHYRLILRVQDERARNFHIAECIKSRWSVRQLQRQINTLFYDRLLSSQDKGGVAGEIGSTVPPLDPRDFIRNPYVLGFSNIPSSPTLYERDLETYIIDHLQTFLLELGVVFSFVGCHQRILFGW